MSLMRVKHIKCLIIRNMGGTAEYSSLIDEYSAFFDAKALQAKLMLA